MSTTRLSAISLTVFVAFAAGFYSFRYTRAQSNGGPFKPIVEAKMPTGFPSYTRPGEVAIKNYPRYRKAETAVGAGSTFWTLFSHIKRNGVAMTAPVEMTFSESDQLKEKSMAFLYGSTDIGEPGRQGKVEVKDVPALTVISTGVLGPRNSESVAEARQRLNDWLDSQKSRYVSAGSLRVMGYNSPFVPRNRNYFEVEIPIRPIDSND